MTDQERPKNLPSWSRWPPNCCETCVGPWTRDRNIEHVGRCEKHDSLCVGESTDSRYRCPAFVRRDGI